MVHWDWQANAPAVPPPGREGEPGWCVRRGMVPGRPPPPPSPRLRAHPTSHPPPPPPPRWASLKATLGPPLVDPGVPDAGVAAWLDAHTLPVHSRRT